MRNLAFFVFIVFFVTACTHTHIAKFDAAGKKILEASNISIGWDRENVTLDLSKSKEETGLTIGIGKSGGSEGFQAAIKKLEDALALMKAGAL
jgi:hypothetical protein